MEMDCHELVLSYCGHTFVMPKKIPAPLAPNMFSPGGKEEGHPPPLQGAHPMLSHC